MIFRHRALRGQGSHDGQRIGFGKFNEIVGRAGPERAASDVDQRLFRSLHDLQELVYIIGVGTEAHPAHFLVRRNFRLRHADILWDFDNDWPWPAGLTERKGAAKYFRHALGRWNTEGPLRHRRERFQVWHLLQHALGELLARAVTENHHQGNTIGKRVDDGGKGVAPPRPLGDHRHAGLAGAARIAVRHENRRLFVARQDQRDLAVLVKGVEQRQNIVTGQPGDEFHVFGLENVNDGVGNAHHQGYLLPGKFLEEAFFLKLVQKFQIDEVRRIFRFERRLFFREEIEHEPYSFQRRIQILI